MEYVYTQGLAKIAQVETMDLIAHFREMGWLEGKSNLVVTPVAAEMFGAKMGNLHGKKSQHPLWPENVNLEKLLISHLPKSQAHSSPAPQGFTMHGDIVPKIDWIVPPGPIAFDNLCEQRVLGDHHGFVSLKMKRVLRFESRLEQKFARLLEFAPDIAAYVCQPLTIPFADICNQRISTYTPDFAITTVDGRQAIIEVKPLPFQCRAKSVVKAIASRIFAEEHGIGFALVDEKFTSYTSLRTSNIPPELVEHVRSQVDGKVPIETAKTWLEEFGLEHKHLFALAWHCELAYCESPARHLEAMPMGLSYKQLF